MSLTVMGMILFILGIIFIVCMAMDNMHMIKNYQNLGATDKYIILVQFIGMIMIFYAELKILAGMGVIK